MMKEISGRGRLSRRASEAREADSNRVSNEGHTEIAFTEDVATPANRAVGAY
jgi:hypothetical protein